ncbi:MAG: hypothetical protein ACRBB5_01325 [Nitrosopumilus sp.]
MKIRIFENDETIRVYHSPREVIVRPKAKIIEIYDTNGLLTEKYNLVEKNLSWLEDKDTDCVEIVLDLKVTKT